MLFKSMQAACKSLQALPSPQIGLFEAESQEWCKLSCA